MCEHRDAACAAHTLSLYLGATCVCVPVHGSDAAHTLVLVSVLLVVARRDVVTPLVRLCAEPLGSSLDSAQTTALHGTRVHLSS